MEEAEPQGIEKLKTRLVRGQISRRDFLRSVGLFGLTIGVGEFIAGCSPSSEPAPTETPLFKPFIPYTDNIDPTEMYEGLNVETPLPGSETAKPVYQPKATSTLPKNITWYCAACEEAFQTKDELIRHAAKKHQWRLPEIHRVEMPTYSDFIVGRIERFDEKNTVFSRTMWDEKYQALVQEATAKAKPADLTTLEGKAMIAGAIFVDDTAGALHPNYYGYSGHVGGDAGLYGWDDLVNSEQFPVNDPAWMTERVKQVARFYGANLVGVTKVNSNWIYSHYFERATGLHDRINLPYTYAIVMGIEMNWDWIKDSPYAEASAATALIYSRMAETAGSLAKYIRALGYPAVPSGNDTGQSIPLAIDAGLGELGRNGLLLSPQYGPRQRLCKVFTNLPLVPDQPIDFGIQRYCETCHACASACPANAIRMEERTTEPTSISNRTGILRWPVNVTNCYLFWRQNQGIDCANCVAACPWAIQNPRDWIETETW